ncbi:unnamed protein product [Rotaria sordida]|uniref:Uncharacterized protein n=1 Tax=Rotaria sordida TaxID=392033 RepID=A0A813ZIF4_9BILA|nr:unnamed protein product [Rotaria sordida]CAF0898763.1 unnamed protein product [Rotaria sordida]
MMADNNNNQPRTTFELQYLIEQEKTKREEEKTKRKRLEEETKRENKKIDEETKQTKRKNKEIEEEEKTKRIKMQRTQSSLTDILWSSHKDFYGYVVDGNLYNFEIDWVSSNDNDYFNDRIKNYIKDYLNELSSLKRVYETDLQKNFNDLIANLLNAYDDSTLLQYKNTVGSSYLESKYSPDCTFIFKNIDVSNECLQDFVVCLGELKCPDQSMTETKCIGQLLQYLHIKFYYVERRQNSSDYNYYQSKSFQIYDSSFEKLPINNRQKITTNEKSKKKFHYCEDTWKIFTKFLIMNMNFYRYETLNIDPCDNQLNKYLITNRLGYGLTSKVYLLNDKENNNENQQTNNNNKRKQENNTNDIKSHVIKISKNNGYSSEFLNELMITKKLKEKDIHKFESFFQEIIYSSPTGNDFLYYFLKIFNRLKDYKE